MDDERPVECKARQYSDQMQCECGLTWDTNDPDPPPCMAANQVPVSQGQTILDRIKSSLVRG